jgi:hypothetical protein
MNNSNRLLIVIVLLLTLASCKASRNEVARYSFEGDGYSTLEYVFNASELFFCVDSTFIFTDFGSFSRRDRRKHIYWRREDFTGLIEYKGDTIRCIVREPSEFSGSQHVFYLHGTRIWLLDYNKHPLQRWHISRK